MAQVVTNSPLVERNTKLGRWITTGSLIVILAPLAITLPTLFSGKNDLPTEQLLILYGALLLGLIMSNVGGYFLNRWGFKYYENVGNALKGTDKRVRLYNYSLPVPHVLLTPYGVTVLLLKNVDGQVYANPKGWRMNVGFTRFLRWFSTEQLGDPTKDLDAQCDKLRAFIAENLGENFKPPIDGLIVFTNPKVNVEITNVELPVVVLNQGSDELKNALKRPKGAPQLPKADYDKLYTLFEEEANTRRAEAERGIVIAGFKIF
ncbi:MAG TPA: nuclease-related domain-containing protein [Anaerolineae bacterium]|nr:nuclease-related domain-containing protein [Anaerolineae bacterium]